MFFEKHAIEKLRNMEKSATKCIFAVHEDTLA